MFLSTYYRNPKKGNEFATFCDKKCFEIFNYSLDKNLLDDGISILENKNDSTITIVSNGINKKQNQDGLSLFPENMSFLTYLFRQNDIIDLTILCDPYYKSNFNY